MISHNSSLKTSFLVTLSLNTSLHIHAQTLSLLALQRATPNLPLKLISPGRTLLKRGSLYQVERGSAPVQREFLLFSDCLLWLAPIESHSWDWDWSWSGSGISQNSAGTTDSKASTTDMIRTRNKSEAEISSLKDDSGYPNDRGAFNDPLIDPLDLTQQWIRLCVVVCHDPLGSYRAHHLPVQSKPSRRLDYFFDKCVRSAPDPDPCENITYIYIYIVR